MPADTGFPRADVENDFMRARRRQTLARLAHRLRRGPDDVNLILPFDEVIAALGMRGERQLGLRTIRLDTIVGTVDSRRDFDRVGDMHFVKDGHHRVSIAIATGLETIDAYVTEVTTIVPASGIRSRGD